MIKKSIIFLSAILTVISFTSCEKEVDERAADELLRLQAYMRINYPSLEPSSSGLYSIIYEQGEGKVPEKDDYILFDFIAKTLDEDVFETSHSNVAYLHDIFTKRVRYAPTYIKYQDDIKPLIKGLAEGMGYLNEGGKARLIMPSNLAYGANRYRELYPYTSIIFDVELRKVVTDPEAYELEQIHTFIAENYPDLVIEDILIDGIYFLEIEQEESEIVEGDDGEEEVIGPEPIEEDDEVSVHYAGRLVDNWLFDTSIREVAQENGTFESNKTYEPLKVKVGGTGLIEGFSLALQNLTTKTTAKVIIPSSFAYGVLGQDQIPPYAPLVFELRIGDKTSTGGGASK